MPLYHLALNALKSEEWSRTVAPTQVASRFLSINNWRYYETHIRKDMVFQNLRLVEK